MNILDHISESLETIFWVKKPGSGIFLTLDPGWKKITGPGSGINIPDPQHCIFGRPDPDLLNMDRKHWFWNEKYLPET
jgi:hypothetical protein